MISPVTRREILAVSLPAAASAVLNNAFRIIDQLAAGSIGTEAQAAVGSCTFVLIGVFFTHALIASGAGPLIARATGAGDEAERRRLFGNALLGAAAIGVGVALVGVPLAPLIVQFLGLTGGTAEKATIFLQVLAAFGLPLALAPTLDATFVALGHTRTMMVLQVLAAVLNTALNPLFIHTFGWGVAGSAVATILARTVATTLGVWVLWRRLGMTRSDLRPGPRLARMARIGLPVTANGCFYAGVYWALLRTSISPLGAVQNAALGIGFSALEGFTYPIFLGLSLGVSSVVGRRLGAGQPEEALRTGRLAPPMTLAAGLGAATVFRLGAEPLCRLFTRDEAVLAAAVVYAHTLAWSQVAVALEALAEGVLAGSGVTRPIFWWSAPVNALRVPLAWALAFPMGLGALGVWWAINLTSFVKMLGKGTIAARGRWATARLPGGTDPPSPPVVPEG